MSPLHPDVRTRARVELAAHLVDLSEYTAMLADLLVADDAAFCGGELTLCARQIRLRSLHVLVATLRHERADAHPWEFLAQALGEQRPADAVAARYASTVTAWLGAADADRAAVPALAGLSPRAGLWVSRIPRDWRAARAWLSDWRARRTGDRAAATAGRCPE